MSKTSLYNGDGYEMVHSELPRGGYVKSYDEVALPNYLVHLTSHNYVIVDIDLEGKLNGRGNGGELDDDGDNVTDFDNTMREVKLDR